MDTSATTSSLIGGWFEDIADAVASSYLDLVCSDELLLELGDVLVRPRIARYISAANAKRAYDLHLQAAVFLEPGAATNICRDPSDDYLLALAEASKAEYLVTRDEDLLVLKEHRGTQIIYPARFMQLLQVARP